MIVTKIIFVQIFFLALPVFEGKLPGTVYKLLDLLNIGRISGTVSGLTGYPAGQSGIRPVRPDIRCIPIKNLKNFLHLLLHNDVQDTADNTPGVVHAEKVHDKLIIKLS
jgi:hypothetical protein